jgi:hypothetical protein
MWFMLGARDVDDPIPRAALLCMTARNAKDVMPSQPVLIKDGKPS